MSVKYLMKFQWNKRLFLLLLILQYILFIFSGNTVHAEYAPAVCPPKGPPRLKFVGLYSKNDNTPAIILNTEGLRKAKIAWSHTWNSNSPDTTWEEYTIGADGIVKTQAQIAPSGRTPSAVKVFIKLYDARDRLVYDNQYVIVMPYIAYSESYNMMSGMVRYVNPGYRNLYNSSVKRTYYSKGENGIRYAIYAHCSGKNYVHIDENYRSLNPNSYTTITYSHPSMNCCRTWFVMQTEVAASFLTTHGYCTNYGWDHQNDYAYVTGLKAVTNGNNISVSWTQTRKTRYFSVNVYDYILNKKWEHKYSSSQNGTYTFTVSPLYGAISVRSYRWVPTVSNGANKRIYVGTPDYNGDLSSIGGGYNNYIIKGFKLEHDGGNNYKIYIDNLGDNSYYYYEMKVFDTHGNQIFATDSMHTKPGNTYRGRITVTSSMLPLKVVYTAKTSVIPYEKVIQYIYQLPN